MKDLNPGMKTKQKKTKKIISKEENKKGKKAFRLRKQLEEDQLKEIKQYDSSEIQDGLRR